MVKDFASLAATGMFWIWFVILFCLPSVLALDEKYRRRSATGDAKAERTPPLVERFVTQKYSHQVTSVPAMSVSMILFIVLVAIAGANMSDVILDLQIKDVVGNSDPLREAVDIRFQNFYTFSFNAIFREINFETPDMQLRALAAFERIEKTPHVTPSNPMFLHLLYQWATPELACIDVAGKRIKSSGCSNPSCNENDPFTGGKCGSAVGCNIGFYNPPLDIPNKLAESSNETVYAAMCAPSQASGAAQGVKAGVAATIEADAATSPPGNISTQVLIGSMTAYGVENIAAGVAAAVKADAGADSTVPGAVAKQVLDGAIAAYGESNITAGVAAAVKADAGADSTAPGGASTPVLVGVLMQQGQSQAAAVATLPALLKVQKDAMIDGWVATLDTADKLYPVIDAVTKGMLIDGWAATLTTPESLLPIIDAATKKLLIDGFMAKLSLPWGTDGKQWCPALPKDEVLNAPMDGVSLHANQPLPTKGFDYCFQQMQEHHGLANTYGGFPRMRVDKKFPANGAIWYSGDIDAKATVPNAIPKVQSEMTSYGLIDGSDYIEVIKEVRAAMLADPKLTGDPNDQTDGHLYPDGIPFLYWEQYVDLEDHLLEKVSWAVGVCFAAVAVLIFVMSVGQASAGIVTLGIACVWAATIVVGLCILTVVQLYGFMALFEVKLNAIPQVTLIMALGLTVEYTAHTVLAFILAEGPSSGNWVETRRARCTEALQQMALPSMHGAATTFVGIFLLAFSDQQYIVKYYFILYFLLIIFGVINGLLVLPAVLTLAGPPSIITASEKVSIPATHVMPADLRMEDITD